MLRAGIGIALIVVLSSVVLGTESSEKGNAPKPNALPVSVVLERVAKSPLGPGEMGLLRAVADLLEKEQATSTQLPSTANSKPATATVPCPMAVPAPSPTPAPAKTSTAQRKRLVYRLSYAPTVEVAKALEKFLEGELADRTTQRFADPLRAVFVAEPVSNSLLVSVSPKIADEVTKLIADLDARPPTVSVDICIAELLPPSRSAKAGDGLGDDLAVQEVPSMEKDGAAWLAWAKQHGRLEVLGRPQIMTLDNQPAVIKIGSTVSTGGTKPSIDASTKGSPIGQAEIGLTVNLTPRISPEGPILLDLDIERASVVNRNGVAGSGVERMSCRTSTWVKDGQTTILHGLVQRTEAGLRETIIAVTARVSPKS